MNFFHTIKPSTDQMIRGHTHCSVDGEHGILKKEWRKRDVFSIEQAALVIEDSSPIAGTNHATILRPENFLNWEKVLATYYKKLPYILFYQEFEMDSKRKGILRYRERQKDSWQETQLSKKKEIEFASIEGIKDVLIQLKPPGISEKKQKHLYDKVRKYVPKKFQDTICTKPDNY